METSLKEPHHPTLNLVSRIDTLGNWRTKRICPKSIRFFKHCNVHFNKSHIPHTHTLSPHPVSLPPTDTERDLRGFRSFQFFVTHSWKNSHKIHRSKLCISVAFNTSHPKHGPCPRHEPFYRYLKYLNLSQSVRSNRKRHQTS